MYKRISILLIVTLLLLLASTAVIADEPGLPWRDHAAPFYFRFGNLIDNHQQSKPVGSGMLQGFIYIQFTGEEIEGVPVAIRAECDKPDLDCRVGWKVKGIPAKATLVSKGPRKWLVDETLLPRSGNHLHFHWVGEPEKPCGLGGQEYKGFLLQRTAVTEFHWLGGNTSNGHGGRLVSPGMDLHSNIVTEWDADSGSSGDHGGGCSGHDGGSGGSGGHDDGSDGHDGGSGGSGGHDDGSDGHDGGSGGSGGHDDGSDGGCAGHEDGEDDGGCAGH